MNFFSRRSKSKRVNSTRGDDTADYNGYLTKRGGLVKNWKHRWCNLKYGVFKYHEDHDTKALKTLYLGAANSVEILKSDKIPVGAPTNYCFVIDYQPHRRNYYFCAVSHEEMHLWVAALQKYTINGPKNEKDLANSMAHALDGPQTSIVNSDKSSEWEDEFKDLSKFKMNTPNIYG